jgi:epoxyqueuosine reductase QueG
VPHAKSIITFGIPLLEIICEWEDLMKDSELVPPEARLDILHNYVYRDNTRKTNELLDIIALMLANFLESEGHRSFYLPATWDPPGYEHIRYLVTDGLGLFSHRHAAVRAGLGEFGLNNLVVNPKHGPRIRWNSVITEVELEPDPLLAEKACRGLDCQYCIDNCPGGAISLRQGIDPDAVWYNPPTRTGIDVCVRTRPQHYCNGRCIRHCPVGKRGAPKV